MKKSILVVSEALGDREWLEGRFTIADLMMITVLRQLRGALIEKFPNMAAYVERGQQRPAFQRALEDQLAVFREHQPEGVPA